MEAFLEQIQGELIGRTYVPLRARRQEMDLTRAWQAKQPSIICSPWAGRPIWGHLRHERVLGLIRNPSYAGVYVFGRYQYRQRITPQGEVRKRVQPVPKADWRVHLPDHHEAISPRRNSSATRSAWRAIGPTAKVPCSAERRVKDWRCCRGY